MKRDVAVTFVAGVPAKEKNTILKRFFEELAGESVLDLSSIPRLFGTDADTDVLMEAYERLPKGMRAKIERVRIFEDAA